MAPPNFDWTVRFPLYVYDRFQQDFLNLGIADGIHPSLAGHVFQDVSFYFDNPATKDADILKMIDLIDSIADQLNIGNAHSYAHKKSAFEVDYQSNGKPSIDFP
ncbi:hypothetical protein HL273_19225 [Yersinia enterocolitica]|uniref:hypothetical protein n=1 Tax=Yersinia enterocolitica TaxID=630 RepID=UPI00155B0BFE|nr:hypothetical protein [Yersinia enterocolitica]MBX9484489.1 hypothetical protein [Yersinia enterocolitica]NQS96018.1 hypothetical protein [Yersinia enterocolitica]NQT45413.1 hypothetical protein [Yersinia enterocolitica]NQU01972.1 hypothetical protein [Yersinia enterocolitica]